MSASGWVSGQKPLHMSSGVPSSASSEVSESGPSVSTQSSEHFSDLSLFCIFATAVPAKLRVTAGIWAYLSPVERAAVLQVSATERQDLQLELLRLSVLLGFGSSQ